jgi:hypothetical protein
LCTRTAKMRKIRDMRTYSHALLTWAAARFLKPSEPGVAAWGAAGAALPDLPAIAGAAWLLARRRRAFSREEFCAEACERGPFGAPDAILHSALPVVTLFALYGTTGLKKHDPRGTLCAFLLGWAGHVLADALTHAEDARPIFWPFSGWRFGSPISYWDSTRHARAFALVEHAAVLLAAAWMLGGGSHERWSRKHRRRSG